MLWKVKSPNPPYPPFYKGGKKGGLLLFLSIFIFISGCSTKVILSDDAVRIRKIDNFVKDMKILYEQRDDHILDLFSKEYLAEASDMKDAILQDMKRFNTISLSLFIDRIEIYNENLNISLQWDGTWEDNEKTYREGGSMVLITSYGDNIRITGIRGDSPFGVSRMINGYED